MGYIYLDLLSRPGKFGHACCVPIQPVSNNNQFSPESLKVFFSSILNSDLPVSINFWADWAKPI